MLKYDMIHPERRFHYCMSLLGFFVDYSRRYSFLYTIRVYNKHFLYQSFRTDVVLYKTTTSSPITHFEEFIKCEMGVIEKYNQFVITQVVIPSYVTI